MLISVFKDAKGTLTRYRTCLSHIQEFLYWKFNLANIDITKIDHSFIMDFEFFLRTEKSCADNSAVKYIKNFGKIIRICLANKWLTCDSFFCYDSKFVEVKRDFLVKSVHFLLTINTGLGLVLSKHGN